MTSRLRTVFPVRRAVEETKILRGRPGYHRTIHRQYSDESSAVKYRRKLSPIRLRAPRYRFRNAGPCAICGNVPIRSASRPSSARTRTVFIAFFRTRFRIRSSRPRDDEIHRVPADSNKPNNTTTTEKKNPGFFVIFIFFRQVWYIIGTVIAVFPAIRVIRGV